jgi:hypothetical protein
MAENAQGANWPQDAGPSTYSEPSKPSTPYLDSIKASSPELYKKITGLSAYSANEAFGGQPQDYQAQLFTPLQQSALKDVPKTITPPTQDYQDSEGSTISTPMPKSIPAGKINGINVNANYDSGGNLTGFSSGLDATTWLDGSHYITGQWDASGNPAPAQHATRSGGFFNNLIGDAFSGISDFMNSDIGKLAMAFGAAAGAPMLAEAIGVSIPQAAAAINVASGVASGQPLDKAITNAATGAATGAIVGQTGIGGAVADATNSPLAGQVASNTASGVLRGQDVGTALSNAAVNVAGGAGAGALNQASTDAQLENFSQGQAEKAYDNSTGPTEQPVLDAIAAEPTAPVNESPLSQPSIEASIPSDEQPSSPLPSEAVIETKAPLGQVPAVDEESGLTAPLSQVNPNADDTTDMGEIEIVGDRPAPELTDTSGLTAPLATVDSNAVQQLIDDSQQQASDAYDNTSAPTEADVIAAAPETKSTDVVDTSQEGSFDPVIIPPSIIKAAVKDVAGGGGGSSATPAAAPAATAAPLAAASATPKPLDTSPQFLSSSVSGSTPAQLQQLHQLYNSLTPELASILTSRNKPQPQKQELTPEEQATLDANPNMTKEQLMQQEYGTKFFAEGGSSLADSGYSIDAPKFKKYDTSMLAAAPTIEQKSRLGALQHLRQGLLARQPTSMGLAHGGLPAKYAEALPPGHKPEFITGLTGYYAQGKGTGQSDDIDAMLHDGDYVADADLVAALGDGSSKAGAEALEKFRRSVPHQEHASGGHAVPAKIADGEYVFPASFVTAIGRGDNKEGAKILDKMREAIRAHKRSAPTSKIPPKAKSPLDYLKMVKG